MSRRIKEYGVFDCDIVSDKIAEKWQPYGSPFVLKDMAYQAMVKYRRTHKDAVKSNCHLCGVELPPPSTCNDCLHPEPEPKVVEEPPGGQ